MKKFFALIIILALVVLLVPGLHPRAEAASQVKVAKLWIGQTYYITNDQKVDMDVAPYINSDNRTLVPLRFLAYSLGVPESGVKWDGNAQTATITGNGTVLVFTIGSNTYTVNGAKKTMDTTPVIINDRTMLPARFVAEALGYDVLWNEDAQTVTVVPHKDGVSDKPEAVRVIESVLGIALNHTSSNRWDQQKDNWAITYQNESAEEYIYILYYPRYTSSYKENYPGLTDVDISKYKPIFSIYFPNNIEEIYGEVVNNYFLVHDLKPADYGFITYEKGIHGVAPYLWIVNRDGVGKENISLKIK